MKKSIKDSAVLIAGDVAGMALGFITSIVFGRYLPTSVFGQYSFVLAVMSAASVFMLPKMQTAITRCLAHGHFGIMWRAAGSVLRWSIIGSLFFLGFASYLIFFGQDPEIGKVLLWVALLWPLYALSPLFNGYFQGLERFNIRALVYVLHMTVLNGLFVAAAFLGASSKVLVLIYLLSSIVVNGVVSAKVILKHRKAKDKVDKDIAFGVKVSLLEVLPQAAHYLDKIILGLFLGFHEVAVFAFAMMIPESIKLLFKNVYNVLLPRYAKKSEKELKGSIWSQVGLTAAVTILGVGAYIALAPSLFGLLFPQYLESVPYSQVIALSLLFLPSKLLLTALEAHYKINALVVYNTFLPIQKFILMFLLIWLFGIWGAVWALVLNRLVELLIVPILFIRFISSNDKSFFKEISLLLD